MLLFLGLFLFAELRSSAVLSLVQDCAFLRELTLRCFAPERAAARLLMFVLATPVLLVFAALCRTQRYCARARPLVHEAL